MDFRRARQQRFDFIEIGGIILVFQKILCRFDPSIKLKDAQDVCVFLIIAIEISKMLWIASNGRGHVSLPNRAHVISPARCRAMNDEKCVL